MSSCFWINLVNKDTKEETCLFELWEIHARELDDNVCLAYNEYTLLTKDFFQKICDCYKNKIKRREENIKKSKEEQKKLVETIETAKPSDVIIYIDDLRDNSEAIYWCEKEMATYKEFLSGLERVWEIFELNEDHKNKKHYELWYYYS